MIDIEKLSDEELEALSKKFEAIRAECHARRQEFHGPDTTGESHISYSIPAIKSGNPVFT
jgi:hypothetical protein